MIQRLFSHITVVLNNRKCILKWSNRGDTSKNIGDALNPFLFEKIFNKTPVNSREVLNIGVPRVYSFIGSTLDNSNLKNLIVIGSGFKRKDSTMLSKPTKVIACRGPLTRKKLIDLGVEVPEVFGDPAILLPYFLNPKTSIDYKMGIIPHYVDQDNKIVRKLSKLEGVKLLNVFNDMEKFVNDLKKCEFTISSSLHGVILSHSYGIPSVWIKLSENIAGGDFKFLDYYKSVGLNVAPVILKDPNLSIGELKQKSNLPDLTELKEDLLSALKKFDL